MARCTTRRIDRVGGVFGRLTVLSLHGIDQHRRSIWLCSCECGAEKLVGDAVLTQNKTKSCGCLRRESASKTYQEKLRDRSRTKKHGMRKSRVYTTWCDMKSRCLNKKNKRYACYGGRGIAIEPRWMEFANFYQDMGDPPQGTSIERIDNNGNYEKGNCRWATIKEQNLNRRATVRIDFNGESKTVTEWDAALGWKPGRLTSRLRSGWPVADALTRPLGWRLKRKHLNS